MNDENLKKGEATRFTAGESAARNGRKGGIATAKKKRRKDTLRKNLKWMLALKPQTTDAMKKALVKLGYDPNEDFTLEDLITVGILQKALNKDLRAIEMIYEFLEEDPHTVLEEKRLKVEKEAVEALKNSDGFMEAMGNVVEEVFDDDSEGGDTPDTLEDT